MLWWAEVLIQWSSCKFNSTLIWLNKFSFRSSRWSRRWWDCSLLRLFPFLVESFCWFIVASFLPPFFVEYISSSERVTKTKIKCFCCSAYLLLQKVFGRNILFQKWKNHVKYEKCQVVCYWFYFHHRKYYNYINAV